MESEGLKKTRERIKLIIGDLSLDSVTRNMKIQEIINELHSGASNSKKNKSSSSTIDKNSDGDTDTSLPSLDTTITYHNLKRSQLGCKHYQRGCKILAECCHQLYTCRVCHDDVTTHKINRFNTTKVFCLSCSTLQPVSEHCQFCQIRFARYFCPTCKFYDNDPNKEIFHCEFCGICRIGTPETVFHCDECGTCINIGFKNNHKHSRSILDSQCAICQQEMFTSRDSVQFFRNCTHCLHTKCFKKLLRTQNNCPTCRRSLIDMSEYWKSCQLLIDTYPMDGIFSNTTAKILCNDCCSTSEVKFHYYGNGCSACKSFNTSITSTENFPTAEQITHADLRDLLRQNVIREEHEESTSNDDERNQGTYISVDSDTHLAIYDEADSQGSTSD